MAERPRLASHLDAMRRRIAAVLGTREEHINVKAKTMEGLDAVSFSGGTGEHDAPLRAEVLESLGFLGLRLDESANRTGLGLITTPDSTIAALVIQTNEEIIVARETVRVLATR